MIKDAISLIRSAPRIAAGAADLGLEAARRTLATGVRLVGIGADAIGLGGEAAPPRAPRVDPFAPPEMPEPVAEPESPDPSARAAEVLADEQRLAADEPHTVLPAMPSAGGHIEDDPEVVRESADRGMEGGAGASLHISEPWEGYATQPDGEVIARLSSEDAGVLALAALFEQANAGRRDVLAAVHGELASRERSSQA